MFSIIEAIHSTLMRIAEDNFFFFIVMLQNVKSSYRNKKHFIQ